MEERETSGKSILQYIVSPAIHGTSDDGGKEGWWKRYNVYLPSSTGCSANSIFLSTSIKPAYQLCKIVVNNNVSVSHLVAFTMKLFVSSGL